MYIDEATRYDYPHVKYKVKSVKYKVRLWRVLDAKLTFGIHSRHVECRRNWEG